MSINEMLLLFVEVVKGYKKDDIVGLFCLGVGFYIIKV